MIATDHTCNCPFCRHSHTTGTATGDTITITVSGTGAVSFPFPKLPKLPARLPAEPPGDHTRPLKSQTTGDPVACRGIGNRVPLHEGQAAPANKRRPACDVTKAGRSISPVPVGQLKQGPGVISLSSWLAPGPKNRKATEGAKMGTVKREILCAVAMIGAFVPIMFVNCAWFSEPDMTFAQALSRFWPLELVALASLTAFVRLSR